MKKINIFRQSEDEIGYLIWQLTKIWQRGKQKNLFEFGLTGSQMEVLGAIYYLEDEIEITQIVLSQATKVDPMTMSTILRNLEKKGLITRTESKTDTRARVVELTEAGTTLLIKAHEKIEKFRQCVFENLDQETLKTQLKLLLAELNKFEIE